MLLTWIFPEKKMAQKKLLQNPLLRYKGQMSLHCSLVHPAAQAQRAF